MKFKPVFKATVWGGTRLKQLLNKNIPENKKIGESWELSDHPNGRSVIINGSYKGKTLNQIKGLDRERLLGKKASENYPDRFPLLIKFLDASDILSVQVHPDDAYAGKYENDLGKTEMWYILQSERSELVYGLNSGVTKDQLADSIKQGTVTELLQKVKVNPEDVVFIPAGCVHAIGKGIVLVEIQENSDTTYRVFDWNRMGLDGKPRQLHVQKALEIIDYQFRGNITRGKNNFNGYREMKLLASSAYFETVLVNIKKHFTDKNQYNSFIIYIIISGEGQIEYDVLEQSGNVIDFVKGDTLLVPSIIKRMDINTDTKCKIIRVTY